MEGKNIWSALQMILTVTEAEGAQRAQNKANTALYPLSMGPDSFGRSDNLKSRWQIHQIFWTGISSSLQKESLPTSKPRGTTTMLPVLLQRQSTARTCARKAKKESRWPALGLELMKGIGQVNQKKPELKGHKKLRCCRWRIRRELKLESTSRSSLAII